MGRNTVHYLRRTTQQRVVYETYLERPSPDCLEYCDKDPEFQMTFLNSNSRRSMTLSRYSSIPIWKQAMRS